MVDELIKPQSGGGPAGDVEERSYQGNSDSDEPSREGDQYDGYIPASPKS